MSTMIYEVYDAFKAAGTPEDKAKAAAEALTSFNEKLASLDTRLAVVETELRIIKWMNGAIIAGVLSLVIKTFFM